MARATYKIIGPTRYDPGDGSLSWDIGQSGIITDVVYPSDVRVDAPDIYLGEMAIPFPPSSLIAVSLEECQRINIERPCGQCANRKICGKVP